MTRPLRLPIQSADFLARRAAANTVPCRGCRAHPDHTCRNTKTGQPLVVAPAHTVRETDATRHTQPPLQLDDGTNQP